MSSSIQVDTSEVIRDETRRGSPFAPASMEQVAFPTEELSLDSAVLSAAVTASFVEMMFAVACLFWFPVGGAVVAGLGCGLAVLGLFSPRRTWAMIALLIHIGLFAACYSL